MSYPPLPSNGETNWGTKFTTWADAIESGKVEGAGLSLRRDTTVGTRVFLDHPGGSTMLWGDTGLRNIWADLQPGFTIDGSSGKARIRRTTHFVEVNLFLYVSDDAPFLGESRKITRSILNLAPEMRPANIYGINGSVTIGISEVQAALTPSPTAIRIRSEGTWQAGDSIQAQAVYSPIAEWPTTLPGTPV